MKSNKKQYNVEISCGCGVGGSRWDELMYLNPSDVKALLDGNITFISGEVVKTGKTKMIGTRWIVTIEEA